MDQGRGVRRKSGVIHSGRQHAGPALADDTERPRQAKRLTKNELSDFSRLWHDGCGETIIEAQHVDRNHSPEV